MAFSLVVGSVSFAGAKPAVRDLRWVYIKNFVHFISWPKNQDTQVVNICIVGRNPFTNVEMDKNLSKKSGRITKARHYEKIPDIKLMAQCQMIYFSADITKPQLSYIFNHLGALPIVTIGDHGAFLKLGGLFQFIPKGKKLRFGINRALLNKLDLKVSPSLLRLAK